MKIRLAWCGGASARGFKVRVLRWRSGWGCGSSAGFFMGLIGLIGLIGPIGPMVLMGILWALRERRGDAYGCHLPARGGPPTCAGLLLAWWSVGGAVGGRGRFAARGALFQ